MRIHRKQSPQAAEHTYEAHSTYTASLGVPDRRQYRRTPPGAPTVVDLVRPGDTVTSYNTGGVVIEVKEYFYAARPVRHFRTSLSSTYRRTTLQTIVIPIVTGSMNASPRTTAGS